MARSSAKTYTLDATPQSYTETYGVFSYKLEQKLNISTLTKLNPLNKMLEISQWHTLLTVYISSLFRIEQLNALK